MRRIVSILALTALIFSLAGCDKQETTAKNKVDTGFKTYYELDDGTWQMDELNYKYRLEISGKMPNAVSDSTFVYLSNIKNISFEQAWKASGLSSSTDDYFNIKDAVLVDIN